MTDEIVGGAGWLREVPGLAPGQGGPVPGRPGGSRAGSKIALLAVVALLFGYVVTHRYSTPHSTAAAVPAVPAIPGVPARPALPWRGGRTGTGPPGLRLLVGDHDPRLVDAGTGRASALPGLAVQPGSVLSVFPLGGALAAVTEPYGGYGGRFLVRPGARPLLLGSDPGVLPSRDGQLILTSYRSSGTTVSGFTLDRRLRWQWQLPGLVVGLRDTPSGLLVQQYDGPHGRESDLLLIDPRSGTIRRRIGRGLVTASTDTAVAWMPADCADPCALRVTQLTTGAVRRYPMPSYRTPEHGAFSPDGHTLALTFQAAGWSGTSWPGFVATLDLRRSELTRVRDVRTGSDLGAEVGWSPDSRWLVVVVNWPDRQRVALWRAGRLLVLPADLPGHPGPLTVLP